MYTRATYHDREVLVLTPESELQALWLAAVGSPKHWYSLHPRPSFASRTQHQHTVPALVDLLVLASRARPISSIVLSLDFLSGLSAIEHVAYIGL